MPGKHPTIQRAQSPRKGGTRAVESGSGKQQWHAVAVVAPAHACEAARLLRGHRFLSGEAPRLPLECCPSPEHCQCTFRHFKDRRSGSRRGTDRGEQITRRPMIGERRSSGGRRKSDHEDEFDN
jgi:hypothetical protein